MINETIVQAMQVGGNAGLLIMGAVLMKIQARVVRLEIREELSRVASKN